MALSRLNDMIMPGVLVYSSCTNPSSVNEWSRSSLLQLLLDLVDCQSGMIPTKFVADFTLI